jgi:chemotaxis regulatin CheY-phosphate phosphatase CheZ
MNDDFKALIRESAYQTADQTGKALERAADVATDALKAARPHVDKLVADAVSLVKRFRSSS